MFKRESIKMVSHETVSNGIAHFRSWVLMITLTHINISAIKVVPIPPLVIADFIIGIRPASQYFFKRRKLNT